MLLRQSPTADLRTGVRVTAHLTQTMRLLAMPFAELAQEVERALYENPVLEAAPERRCALCGRLLIEDARCPACYPTGNAEEPVVFVCGHEGRYGLEAMSEEVLDAPLPDYRETLAEHVLRQIRCDLPEAERPLAAQLLAMLDEDGLIRASLMELAALCRADMRRIRRVLDLIQSADPPGVGAHDEVEAMRIQARRLAEHTTIPPLVEVLLEQGLHALAHRTPAEWAHQLQTSKAEVEAALRFIRQNLVPRPAQIHWESHPVEPPTVFHQPDIIIHHHKQRTGGRLIVEILLPLRAPLRVSPDLQAALAQSSGGHTERLRRHIEDATLFAKCLLDRQHTLQALMNFLAAYQRAYILHGDRHMRPLTRAQVAHVLGVHESTISRAVKNKIVQLPSGRLVPLDIFFDRSLHLRTLIRQMIDEERQPLSDAHIAQRLREAGFQVARRTVTKYRTMLGIPAAHQRKRERMA